MMIGLPGKVARAVVGLALMTAMTQVASAQPRGGRGRGFGPSSVRLATLEQVQNELKMTEEQKAKVAEISDQLDSGRRELFQQGPENFEANRAKLDMLNREAADKISQVLHELQLKRLAGIAAQVNGPLALNDPVVVDQLDLSDGQKAKLDEIRAENWRAFRDAMDQTEDMSREERRAKFAQIGEEGNKKAWAVLSPEQQTAFEQLKGTTIEIDMSQLFPGRGRGGN